MASGIFGQKFLLGVEGDIGAFDASRRVVDWDDPELTYRTKTSWLATLRGRVGLTNGPNLSYFTAGYAALNLKDSNIETSTGVESSSQKTKGGYVLGSGVETMLGGGWSAKTEYLYVNVGAGDVVTNPDPALVIQTNQHRYHSNALA